MNTLAQRAQRFVAHGLIPYRPLRLAFAILILSSLCFSTTSSQAYFDGNRKYDGQHVMNGIDFNKYRDFPAKWKFVTVRYREDSGELRLTYANPAAYAHLQKMKTAKVKTPYPDGSIFGKVSFLTEKDPKFTSSKVPSESRRYQLMIHDKKKFKETDGWGYALFDSRGVTYNEEPVAKTMACHACHTLVKESNFVFSVDMPIGVGSNVKSKASPLNLEWLAVDLTNTAAVSSAKIPLKLVALVTNKSAKFERLDPKILKSFFSGTLDEITPTLLARSRETGNAVAYVGDDENFSFVQPTANSNKECRRIQIYFRGKSVRDEEYCGRG